jgi:hypothetical protein
MRGQLGASADVSSGAVLLPPAGADGRFLASAISRRDSLPARLDAGILSGTMALYKPNQVSRQLPQVASGNRRPQRSGVCAGPRFRGNLNAMVVALVSINMSCADEIKEVPCTESTLT